MELQWRTVNFLNAVSSQNSGVDRSKERKTRGPNVHVNCADPLADIYTFIFSVSLQLHKVPSLWKDFNSVPGPKPPKSLDDFRPVALTSLVLKFRLIWWEPRLLPVFYSLTFHLAFNQPHIWHSRLLQWNTSRLSPFHLYCLFCTQTSVAANMWAITSWNLQTTPEWCPCRAVTTLAMAM